MITQILHTQGIDISAFIGGKLPCIGGSGKAGSSDILVCEACEFVDTFLKLYPDTSVILNIDADHLDYFKTLDNIIASFRKFAEKTTKTLIVNADDANTMKAIDGCIYFDKDKTAEQTNECKQADFDKVTDFLCENAEDGDLIITMGCGDVYKVAKAVYNKL